MIFTRMHQVRVSFKCIEIALPIMARLSNSFGDPFIFLYCALVAASMEHWICHSLDNIDQPCR